MKPPRPIGKAAAGEGWSQSARTLLFADDPGFRNGGPCAPQISTGRAPGSASGQRQKDASL